MLDPGLGTSKKVVPGKLDIWGEYRTINALIDAGARDGGIDGGGSSKQLKAGLVVARKIPREASITHGTFAVDNTYTFEGVADTDPASPSANDVYFNPTTNVFRLYGGSSWADTTLAIITANTNAVGIGIGSGDPAPVVINSEDAVVAYFVENGFTATNLYVYYDASAGEVRTATAFTAAVIGDGYSDYDTDADDGTQLEENSAVLLDIIPDISTGDQWATVLVAGVVPREQLRFRTAADKTAFEFGKAPFHSV